MKSIWRTLALLSALWCGSAFAGVELQPVSFKQLPGWQQADLSLSLQAFQKSCGRLVAKGWPAVCQQAWQLENTDPKSARAFFENYFTPMRVSENSQVKGLFTGYYTPELEGSLTQHGVYQVPVYGRPRDLDPQQPYATRAQIDAGALTGKSQIILWLQSKVDRFFLQVQGSGLVQLDRGKTVQLAFDGKNGQPYSPIGKLLLKQGQLQPGQVTMETIKAWLLAHPQQANSVMEQNASFVFFKLAPAPAHFAPTGAAGVPLTPARSLAVDKQYIPLGTPLWLATTVIQDKKTQPFQELMIAQDTGSAIRGAIRGDVFWGVGDKAAAIAGPMQSQGQYWMLVPRG